MLEVGAEGQQDCGEPVEGSVSGEVRGRAAGSRALERLGDSDSIMESLCPLPWVVFYDGKGSAFGV